MVSLMPSQFPCLVKAVYSFAGESKGDLGFVQGDLIECLNAGDGQWWFGRLKRNKTMGVFPSNYVELVFVHTKIPCLMLCRDNRPSSKSSNETSRPSSRHSQLRPNSSQADQRALRSFQSYGQDLNSGYPPSSSSERRTQLHAARSMTSMSQYRDSYPRYSGRSPSPAFYAAQDHYGTYDDIEDDLNYPVEDTDYYYDDALDYQRGQRHTSNRPRSPVGLPPTMRQTPSPLRWAMQDLMDSLDTMTPQLPSASSPPPDTFDQDIMQPDDHILARYSTVGWGAEVEPQFHDSGDVMAQYMYPNDMRPPPLLDYVDRMQSKLNQFQNYHHSPERDERQSYHLHEEDGSLSRLSTRQDIRPRSSHSFDKPLPASPSAYPPMPPPHRQANRGTESVTSHSTKHSIFSSNSSEYSTAASSVSNSSAGSAGSFAKKRVYQQAHETEATGRRTALSVLPKSNTNAALKRRKSYGSSLKKTIGKLLNVSPTKPPPGTVTDHGGKIIEWQNVRRDVNRANTPLPQERAEYRERLEMSEGAKVVPPIEVLQQIVEGDESANGTPILPDETFDISSMARLYALMCPGVNFSLIDRSTRLINQIPPQYLSSPATFAKAVICRPYTSEIQRLRAIFVFLSEKFTWEPLHGTDHHDQNRDNDSLVKLFETRRGTSEEIALCFWEMCHGCNIHAEIISGHLKGETF